MRKALNSVEIMDASKELNIPKAQLKSVKSGNIATLLSGIIKSKLLYKNSKYLKNINQI